MQFRNIKLAFAFYTTPHRRAFTDLVPCIKSMKILGDDDDSDDGGGNKVKPSGD